MNAISLITYRPNNIWCDFLNNFKNYKIFMIVDDNNFDLTYFINHYKNITFIQVLEDKCKMTGHIDTNFCIGKLISGWDKALYYFGVENRNYRFIWFIEDDVFFYNEDTFFEIDKKYLEDDLLSKQYGENINGEKLTWHWGRITIKYSPPYYSGMMCIVRFSQNMITCINKYANEHKTLFFLEALFPTIAIKNSLKYSTPNEFNNIYYRHNFKQEDINEKNLYHPIKDINMHTILRKELLSTEERSVNVLKEDYSNIVIPHSTSNDIVHEKIKLKRSQTPNEILTRFSVTIPPTSQQYFSVSKKFSKEQIKNILYLSLLEKHKARKNKKLISMMIM